MIVIVDNVFPYMGGETFLENEIKIAADMCEKVVVFPLEADTNKDILTLPQNIHVENQVSRRHANGLQMIFDLLRAVFTPMLWDDLIYWKRHKTLTAKGVAAAIVYLAKAKRNARLIEHVLSEKYRDEEYIFYSYWMHTPAVTCAFLKKKFPNSKFVTRCHGYDLYEYRASSKYLPYRRFLFENADGIYPISQNGYDYLKENYDFLDLNKVKMSYLGTQDHGINTSEFYDEPGLFHIVTCSNLIPLKRVHLVIEALQLLKNKYRIKWTHYGDGYLRDSLEQLAQKLLGDDVEYHFKGQLSNEQLMEEYAKQSIDLFINVSESEGLPVSIMEAMSFGIPVIATDVGGTSEIVKDGVNGNLLHRDFAVEQLGELIERYINQEKDEKQLYRLEARKSWEHRFNRNNNYSHFYTNL